MYFISNKIFENHLQLINHRIKIKGEPRKDTDICRFRPTVEELEKHEGTLKKMFQEA